VALVERLLEENPLPFSLADLHVLSRKYTGVGSFTTFLVRNHPKAGRKILQTSAMIRMPSLKHGLGFMAFYEGEELVLETFTCGDEKWDGVFEGFELQSAGSR
jgi:hypothetical protein